MDGGAVSSVRRVRACEPVWTAVVRRELAGSDAAKAVALDHRIEHDGVEKGREGPRWPGPRLAEIQAVDPLDCVGDVDGRQFQKTRWVESVIQERRWWRSRGTAYADLLLDGWQPWLGNRRSLRCLPPAPNQRGEFIGDASRIGAKAAARRGQRTTSRRAESSGGEALAEREPGQVRRHVGGAAVFAGTSSLSTRSRKSAYDSSWADASWSSASSRSGTVFRRSRCRVLVEPGQRRRDHSAPPRP